MTTPQQGDCCVYCPWSTGSGEGKEMRDENGDYQRSPSTQCTQTFITHIDPTKCPLGALAVYLHYLFNYYKLSDKMEIDWAVNKSWHVVCLIFGSEPMVPYNENNLYNLYHQVYKKAGLDYNIEAHLLCHMLEYLQEKLGVEGDQTSKLGWSRDTYNDIYTPVLQKKAIFSTHGYKAHQDYNPVWRHVQVPEAFLQLICPMAEGILESIRGALCSMLPSKFGTL
ncbi:hypothetical protein AZE42_08365 [Rhizopogon vesiculosus]|uniref:Ndc10 domain-containing protein n=1 Tax=Rhizopogon vesiculosus TaxID=180088 RepID=A0A1J8PP30_9AGAM|nr:hypothetical protein AZE42_08365 [Rhizopogon vesiculosus]